MFVCCVGLSIFLLTIPKISTSTDPQKGEGAAFPSGPGDIAGIVRSVRGIARKFGLHDSDELVNFDLQGDGGGNNISYAKGRAGEVRRNRNRPRLPNRPLIDISPKTHWDCMRNVVERSIRFVTKATKFSKHT